VYKIDTCRSLQPVQVVVHWYQHVASLLRLGQHLDSVLEKRKGPDLVLDLVLL
jgi:hypothetical protein